MKTDCETVIADAEEWLRQAVARTVALQMQTAERDALLQRCVRDFVVAIDAPLVAALRDAAMAQRG